VLLLLFLTSACFSEIIKEKQINLGAVYLNATIEGKRGCFAHNRCIQYSYDYKGVSYKDYNTTDEFYKCNGLNLDKGSTFSIVIDSLNPEDNEIDPKYGCE
jgi:hypothetical protein